MPRRSDEPAWANEKREFVADSRDEAADARDAVADARDAAAESRDALADDREAMLDRREESLRLGAGQLGPATDKVAAAQRTRAVIERDRGAEDRRRLSDVRRDVDEAREAAARQRADHAQPTLLALAFASIAEHLYDATTYDEVLTRIAEAALATMTGSDSASVMVRDEGEFRTVACTDPSAAGVDEAQYEASEGPSLDALAMTMVEASAFPDERWPVLGAAPTTYGVESSLSYQLHTDPAGVSSGGTGSLNLYALRPAAFDRASQEIGTILAAHASLAARVVGDRITLEHLGRHLEQALLSREVIGEAKGILMERYKLTPDAAFDILRNSSQRLNQKLREVAARLAETGDIRP
jgi:hypothetical protein